MKSRTVVSEREKDGRKRIDKRKEREREKKRGGRYNDEKKRKGEREQYEHISNSRRCLCVGWWAVVVGSRRERSMT